MIPAQFEYVTADSAAQATSLLADPAAFMATLKARGIDPTLALRAMTAYEKYSGIGFAAKAAAQP